MKKRITLILLLALSPLFAIDCANAYSNIEMKECAAQDYEFADKKLNLIYKQLMNKLDSIGKEKLKISQIAWIKFRDSNAEFYADSFREGTGAGLLFLSSKTITTESRVKELQNYLDSVNQQ
jgi:uncharacterized protein YecT (DUF1311 family)